MHRIIEKQKVGTFVKKIELMWPNTVDHTVWETVTEVNVYLIEGLSAIAFVEGLMPQVAMFIDFKSTLIIHYIEFGNNFRKSIVINFEGELVTFLPN